MELRTAASPRDVKHYTTERLREEFLINDLFAPDVIKLVYSHIDRIITGSRHDYFRRILCNLIGGWVDNGEFPADYDTLEEIVKGICYNNAVAYFGFDLKTC